jgi:hypothetical protein
MNNYLLNHVKPFKDSEVPDLGLSNINGNSLIDKHQMCIEIVEAIMHFQLRKKHLIQSINGFGGSFSELRRKYVNNIDTINRCIKRLEERYNRVFNV